MVGRTTLSGFILLYVIKRLCGALDDTTTLIRRNKFDYSVKVLENKSTLFLAQIRATFVLLQRLHNPNLIRTNTKGEVGFFLLCIRWSKTICVQPAYFGLNLPKSLHWMCNDKHDFPLFSPDIRFNTSSISFCVL